LSRKKIIHLNWHGPMGTMAKILDSSIDRLRVIAGLLERRECHLTYRCRLKV